MGMLFTITGRGGSGKSTIEKNLMKWMKNLSKIPSVTTRPVQSFDNSEEYEFVLPSVFKTFKGAGLFLWTVEKFGNSYGTRKRDVEEFAGSDKVGLMALVPSVVPVLKNHIPGKVYSFYILSSDDAELRRRMLERGSSTEAADSRMVETQGWDEAALRMGGFDEYVRNDTGGKDASTASRHIFNVMINILIKQKSAS